MPEHARRVDGKPATAAIASAAAGPAGSVARRGSVRTLGSGWPLVGRPNRVVRREGALQLRARRGRLVGPLERRERQRQPAPAAREVARRPRARDPKALGQALGRVGHPGAPARETRSRGVGPSPADFR